MIGRSIRHAPLSLRSAAIAMLWLCGISLLHAALNGERSTAARVSMGYMPVITNLAAPLVDHATRGKAVHFEALKFASFAEMAEAFRSGHIQVAFIIAPLAIALYDQGVPLKVVYIGNRHESTLVVRKGVAGERLSDMAGRTIAVPIRYSGHLLALKRYLRQQGLDPEVIRTVEIPPPDMAPALSSGGLDGYFVGEPFASKSLLGGMGVRLLDVEAIWPRFICNLMIVREELIRSHPDRVQTLVSASVRAGFWAREHIDEAVSLASGYWGQDPAVIDYAFRHPPERVRFDLYLPAREELEEIAREMGHCGLLQPGRDLSGLVEDRFARAVPVTSVSSLDEI